MMVLVDTSVWVAHFRGHDRTLSATLAQLLAVDMVATHPMVVLELACGTPPQPRARTLSDVATLRSVRQATLAEVHHLIESHVLYGLGCGLVDLSLLASARLTAGATLWSLDQRLVALAKRFDVSFKAANA